MGLWGNFIIHQGIMDRVGKSLPWNGSITTKFNRIAPYELLQGTYYLTGL